jgi:hypothetical protein
VYNWLNIHCLCAEKGKIKALAKNIKKEIKIKKYHAGVNVMITIFCDFYPFSAK